MALLEITDLRTEIQLKDGVVHAVDGVTLHVDEGETLGIVGESGCGKTMTALSIMQLLPNGGRIAGGSIKLAGQELTALQAGGTAQDPRRRHRDDLPGPAVVAQPDAHRGQADRRGGAAAPGRHQGGRLRAGGRGARPGRHAAGQGAGGRVPAPVLRRHAAARHDRDGAGLRAQAADRRRADDRARRDDPEADPRAHRRPAAAARHGGHHGHPRPRRDRRARGPGGRHVRGQGGGDHRDRRRCTPTRATRTPRRSSTRCRRSRRRPGSGCTRFPARRRTWSTRRRAAGSRRAAGTRPTSAAPSRPCSPARPRRTPTACFFPVGAKEKTVGGQLTVVEPLAEPSAEAVEEHPRRRRRAVARRTWSRTSRSPRGMLQRKVGSVSAVAGRVVRHPQGRDARPGRRVRLRQDHDRPHARRPGEADERLDQLRRQGPGPLERPGVPPRAAGHPVHVPGLLRVARPPHARRVDPARAADRAGHRVAPRAARQGQGDARQGRAARVVDRALPARVLRRAAAAARLRPRAACSTRS